MIEEYPVMLGAESLIYSGGEIGIVLCHGFNGTPQSMQYLGEQLSSYGYTVSIPRLHGHGTHYEEMEKSTYKEWIFTLQSAYNNLKQQCEKVFIVGQSMGGALTLQVAASNPSVDGIFLINAAVTDVSLKECVTNKKAERYVVEGKPDIKKPAVFEITYEKVPVKAIQELLNLMEKTKSIVDKIEQPTIIFKSATDHVVPPTNSEFIFNKVNTVNKHMIILQESYHVASMDNDADLLVDKIHFYIGKITKPMVKTPIKA